MKAGDKVFRHCETYKGRFLHKRPYIVTKITKAGFLYAGPDTDTQKPLEKFQKRSDGKWHRWEPKYTAGFRDCRVWLEQPNL